MAVMVRFPGSLLPTKNQALARESSRFAVCEAVSVTERHFFSTVQVPM
jgi:hypothetical protein